MSTKNRFKSTETSTPPLYSSILELKERPRRERRKKNRPGILLTLSSPDRVRLNEVEGRCEIDDLNWDTSSFVLFLKNSAHKQIS